MATYEHNALMQYIDETGNMHINYPATKAENVMMGDSDVQTEINVLQKRPVNNNLLDNPWFTINQRGQSSYTSGYSVDRWKILSGTVTVNAKGITLTSADFIEIIPSEYHLEGQIVTASIMLKDGTVYSGNYTFDINGVTESGSNTLPAYCNQYGQDNYNSPKEQMTLSATFTYYFNSGMFSIETNKS